MVRVTLSSFTPSSPPASGWIVGYRIKGTVGVYLTPVGSPFSAIPIVFSTTDPAGTLYEGFIKCDCGTGVSTNYLWTTPCNCTDGTYSLNLNSTGCIKTDSVSPTITHSGYCLAVSQNGAYNTSGSRIYNPGFTLATLKIAAGTPDTYIYGSMPVFSQWSNTGASSTIGPMNRESVWVDNDCDGTKDSLAVDGALLTANVSGAGSGYTNGTYTNAFLTGGTGTGARATVVVAGAVVVSVTITTPGINYVVGDTFAISPVYLGGTGTGFLGVVASVTNGKTTVGSQYNNLGVARTIFLGVSADNQFKIVVNGTIMVDTGISVGDFQYRIWHILPINIVPGLNFFNAIAKGDGSVNDAIAMVVYDNTAAQILAAASDADLTILFKSSNLRGTTYDTAICPSGYSLDVSGGSGFYTCTRVQTKVCNSAT